MLKMILPQMNINVDVTTDFLEMEKKLLPYIQDEGLYGEVKYKWYHWE